MSRVPGELWTEVCNTVQEAANSTIPTKKTQEGTWLPEEALQTAEKRRGAKRMGEMERFTQLNAEFQKTARPEGLLQ